jgi:hypothetical protein
MRLNRCINACPNVSPDFGGSLPRWGVRLIAACSAHVRFNAAQRIAAALVARFAFPPFSLGSGGAFPFGPLLTLAFGSCLSLAFRALLTLTFCSCLLLTLDTLPFGAFALSARLALTLYPLALCGALTFAVRLNLGRRRRGWARRRRCGDFGLGRRWFWRLRHWRQVRLAECGGRFLATDLRRSGDRRSVGQDLDRYRHWLGRRISAGQAERQHREQQDMDDNSAAQCPSFCPAHRHETEPIPRFLNAE